ncbi:membrane protein PM19L-like [Dioscorea cayenensis subsp. rotundata]|uniref:Membrane protein PM19L-like n=1 Tax=Dioscorea cayennensis subsp. rotundata TaxID=55577 RepID=A0AB40BFP6_DIOCR|nr:membrane protein PM19L-like [Dioscorea cayenensis subsp. rotundata]
MASSPSQNCVILLLLLNFCISLILACIGGWALNYSVQNDYFIDRGVVPPRDYSPVYFPMGNGATGFFVIFSLISGVVGAASSIAGLSKMLPWGSDHGWLPAARSSGFTAWVLTLLSASLAIKEIALEGRNARLRTMEAFNIILAVTQFASIVAIHAA